MELPPPADRKPIQKYIQRGFLLLLRVGAPLPRAPAATPSGGVVPRVAPRRLPPLRAVVALRRPLGRRVLPPSSVCPAALPRVSRPRPPPARGWGAGIRRAAIRGVPAGCFVAWSCHQPVRRPRVARSCASGCCPARAWSSPSRVLLCSCCALALCAVCSWSACPPLLFSSSFRRSRKYRTLSFCKLFEFFPCQFVISSYLWRTISACVRHVVGTLSPIFTQTLWQYCLTSSLLAAANRLALQRSAGCAGALS